MAAEVPRDKPLAWVGRNCRIFWPDDEEWYEAAVRAYDDRIGRHNVWYFYDEEVSQPCSHALIRSLHTAWNHSLVTCKLCCCRYPFVALAAVCAGNAALKVRKSYLGTSMLTSCTALRTVRKSSSTSSGLPILD